MRRVSGTRPRVGAPASRGCRRVRRDASRIATPSARTRARVSLTARMRAGAEGFPRDWRASGAPERARGTRRRFLVLRLDVRRAPSDGRLLEFLPFSPATRTRRDPPTAFAMTTARAPRLARPERTKRRYA